MKKIKKTTVFLLFFTALLTIGAERVLLSPDLTTLVAPSSAQSLTKEGDTTVLTIRTTRQNRANRVSIPIDPALIAGKDVVLSAEVRQENISPSPKPWHGVKLMLDLTCADGRQNSPQVQNAPGTLPWQTRSIGVKVPADLKSASIVLALENVSGTVHFRNVRLVETTIPDYGNFTVTGAANHQNAEYKPGEEMVFTFRILENGNPAGGRLQVTRSGDDGKTETVEQEVKAGEPCIIRTSLDQPGFVMVKAILLDPNGIPAKHRNKRNIQYGVAGGVKADTLKQGVPEPADFDAYWAKQKEKLSAVPVKVLERKLLKETAVSDIYDVKIACAGNRPVSGYLSIPKNSQPASLPLRLHYDGYSVRSAQVIESPDAINFFVNAHGIENNREKAYYDELEKGELRRYGFQNKENLKPETCYFNHMILRDLRALEYARTLPEWNGKDIHIFGGSQGAFQAVAVTGLSDGITSCDIRIPWFCDLGGVKIGRVRGWRPDHASGLDYFDTVNFAKRIKCPVDIFAGLSDWVCPPSGIWILYNNLGGPAKLTMEQGLDHAIYPGHNSSNAAQTTYSKSTMTVSGANMIPDGSFEYNDAPAFNRMGDRDYLAGYGWAPDDSTAFEGRRSLRGEGGKELEFSCEANELLPTEKLPWTFSIYLKASRPDTPVTLKVAVYRKLDSVGEEMPFKVGTGWTRCELTVNKRFSLGRRLGANQGPVNFTVSIPKGVTVWADAAQWEAGKQATRYAASEVDRPVPRAELVRATVPPPLPVPAAVAAEKSGEVGLTVRNGESKPASNVPLSTGILVPRGEFGADTRYTLLDASGREIPCQTEPIALHLADRSILSLKLDFEADLQPGDNRFRLRYDRGPKAAVTAPLSATRQTGGLLFHPARQPDQLWEGFTDRSGKLVVGPGTLAATGIDGRVYRGVNREVRTETDGPLHAVAVISGDLVAEENPAHALLSYDARLHLWKHTPGVTVQLTVINRHPKRTVALRDLFWKAPLPESSGENIALLQAFNPVTGKFRLGTSGEDGGFRFSDDKCATTAVGNRGEGFDYRLQIRDGWRKHPTEAVIRNREAQAFFWPGQPVQPLLFSPGMAVTRTGTLSARPENASPAALQEDPPVVIVDPEWSLRAGIPLRLDRVGKFPALDRYLENYEEHGFFSPDSVETQQWHGLFNYGDHSGDGGWANLESYSDYSTLLRGLRSGSPETLRLGLAAAEHYRDMDVDHIKHFPIMHACNHVIGGTHFGHAWIQGVLLHYLLTGDPRSREVAYQVGNAFLAIPPHDEQIREDRCLGYYLLTLSDYCLMLGDRRYIDRFYTQLKTAEALLAAPETPAERLMQRTTRHRESSLFYWKISGITPFANWYGLAGLLKMYEITGDQKLLPRIRSEMAVVMDFELLYRVHLEELYPNLPPEKTLPLIASDYVGGRGSYFYPVMAAYSRVTGEEKYRDLAARVAYARILEGKNGGDDADILMTALFADLPSGFDEAKMMEEIKSIYLDGAAGELLNGDFSRTRSYAEMMTPKRPDGITPEWARNVQHLRNWRFYAITEFTGTEYMRFRPELYVVADNTLTLRLRRRKWYTRAMIVDSARIKFLPGIWKFKGKVKRDENTRDVAFSFYFSDFRHTWGVLELAVEPGAKPNLQRATSALPKLLGCSVSKPDRDGFMTVEAEFEVTEPSVGFLYFLGVLRPEKANGDISIRELEFKPRK